MKRQNFTLIEILVAMSIIILLASIVSAGAVYIRRNARVTQTKAMIQAIETAIVEYEAEYGYYPKQTTAGPIKVAVLSGLVYPNGRKMIDMNEAIFSNQKGGDLLDPFGNTIFYQAPGTMNDKAFDLWSMGFDGKHGNNGADISAAQTPDENADDINNWTRD